IGGSSPPPRTRSTDLRLRPDPHIADLLVGRRPPSSSGLGHHPLKVAARVRIPLGVPASKPLVSARNVRLARGFGVLGVCGPVLAVPRGPGPDHPVPRPFVPRSCPVVPAGSADWESPVIPRWIEGARSTW